MIIVATFLERSIVGLHLGSTPISNPSFLSFLASRAPCSSSNFKFSGTHKCMLFRHSLLFTTYPFCVTYWWQATRKLHATYHVMCICNERHGGGVVASLLWESGVNHVKVMCCMLGCKGQRHYGHVLVYISYICSLDANLLSVTMNVCGLCNWLVGRVSCLVTRAYGGQLSTLQRVHGNDIE